MEKKDGWYIVLYAVCVMGPKKYFGPTAPQSFNPALNRPAPFPGRMS